MQYKIFLNQFTHFHLKYHTLYSHSAKTFLKQIVSKENHHHSLSGTWVEMLPVGIFADELNDL